MNGQNPRNYGCGSANRHTRREVRADLHPPVSPWSYPQFVRYMRSANRFIGTDWRADIRDYYREPECRPSP